MTQELEASIPKRRRIDYRLGDSDDGDTTEEDEDEGIWTLLGKKFLEDPQIALSWHTCSRIGINACIVNHHNIRKVYMYY